MIPCKIKSCQRRDIRGRMHDEEKRLAKDQTLRRARRREHKITNRKSLLARGLRSQALHRALLSVASVNGRSDADT